MQVSSGRPHMLTSNQRGRGNEPVTVLGRIRLAVAVNMGSSDRHCTSTHVQSGVNAAAGGQPTVSLFGSPNSRLNAKSLHVDYSEAHLAPPETQHIPVQ